MSIWCAVAVSAEEREFYEAEAMRGGWSVRQLDRQISSQFYTRALLSKNKLAMLEKAGRLRLPTESPAYTPGASGNVCTEEIAHALALMGYDTGIDLPLLLAAARRLPALLGHDIPSQIVKAGRRLDLHPRPADFDEIRARALARDTA